MSYSKLMLFTDKLHEHRFMLPSESNTALKLYSIAPGTKCGISLRQTEIENDLEANNDEGIFNENDEDNQHDDNHKNKEEKNPMNHSKSKATFTFNPYSDNPYQRNIPRTESFLNYATHNIINEIEPGSLRATELGIITGLMGAWTSKKKITSKSNEEIALIVEKLLKRVIDERKAGNESARATTRMYTMTIDAWSKSGRKGYAAHRAQSILDSMERMYADGDTEIKPDNYTYNALLNAWAKSGEHDAAMRAETILKRMKNDHTINPDVITYTTVIDSLKNGGRYSAHRALELLNLMQEGDSKVIPNSYTYTTIINVLSKSGDESAANTSLMMLEYMVELVKCGYVSSKPTAMTVNGVLNCLARSRRDDVGAKIDEVLSRMKKPLENNGFEVLPDIVSYNIAIAFFCKQNTLESIERAIDLLEEMKGDEIGPTTNQYNTVIIALSRLNNEKGAQLADSILQKMITSYEAGEKFAVQPNTVTFNACMNAYSRGSGLESAQKAEDLITQMHTLHHSNSYKNLKPDLRSFAAVLQAWCRSGQRRAAALRTEEIIRRMEELYENGDLEYPPDVYCYTIAIGTWANSGSLESDQKAIQLFERMEKMHELGHKNVKPNVRTYNAVLDAIDKSPKGNPDQAKDLLFKMIKRYEEGDLDLKPERFSFNVVIQSYTRTRRPDAGDKAMVVLEKMLLLCHERVLEPDARGFSRLIEHFAKKSSIDAIEKAERLLRTMVNLCVDDEKNETFNERLMPNLFSFEAVMMGYAKTNANAGMKCEEILNLLKDLHASSNLHPRLKPNAYIYNCVLNGYAKSGELQKSAQKAEDILSTLEKEYRKGHEEMCPNAKSYILSMTCFAKSEEKGKAQKVYNILRRMKTQYENGNELAQPNVRAYTILINALAFNNHEDAEEEKESLNIAKIAMKELHECDYDRPNSFTYGSFFRLCGSLNLSQDVIEKEAKVAFHKCCEEGQVNEHVLSQLRNSVSDSIYRELVPEARNVDVKKHHWNRGLPSKWSRNVPDRFLNDTKGTWWTASN